MALAGKDPTSYPFGKLNLELTNDRYDFPREGDAAQARNVNMHVTYPTTPAQYFHLLRRQMMRNYRKPLIVAAPKGLLRLPAASSSLDDMKPGTRFQPVLSTFGEGQVERVILLSGKLYYDLAKEVTTRGLADRVALIRLEELCPFPFFELADALRPFVATATDFIWIQEEPRNQGAWGHVSDRLRAVFASLELGGKVKQVQYRGRPESAVPATGVARWHAAEHAGLLRGAFEGL
ncbi:hypothetical protein FRC00_006296 [Tulasnella sp. 408]|nr:hypothetical protein FRC00_006296 [Tulasnella sp. 408]